MTRIIAHLDMDAFFASVEERDRPRLKGKPIAVGADPKGGKGRGVVSTANYAARTYGIKSAMPITEAWRRSEDARLKGLPEVIFLEGDFGKYGAVSKHVMDILRSHAPMVEEAGIDEAYFDISHLDSWKKAEALCVKIKKEIRDTEHITASIGVGPSKLIAKIASDMQKPDGLTIVPPEKVLDILAPMPVRVIPGIGPKAEQKLLTMKVRTIKDLRAISREQLIEHFGKWGGGIYLRARGEDDSPLENEGVAKSIGEQETFEKDTKDLLFLSDRLTALSGDVHARFLRSGFTSFRTLAITVRFSDFETKSRAHTLSKPEKKKEVLLFESMKLLMPFLDARENPKGKTIRLLGVRVEKLS